MRRIRTKAWVAWGAAALIAATSIACSGSGPRSETGLAVARAEERGAAESVALATHRLAQTEVRAPYAGSVAARLADEGTTALVQPQTIVLVLQEISEQAVELLAGPPVGTAVIVGAAAGRLAPGMRVRAVAAAEPDA